MSNTHQAVQDWASLGIPFMIKGILYGYATGHCSTNRVVWIIIILAKCVLLILGITLRFICLQDKHHRRYYVHKCTCNDGYIVAKCAIVTSLILMLTHAGEMR